MPHDNEILILCTQYQNRMYIFYLGQPYMKIRKSISVSFRCTVKPVLRGHLWDKEKVTL